MQLISFKMIWIKTQANNCVFQTRISNTKDSLVTLEKNVKWTKKKSGVSTYLGYFRENVTTHHWNIYISKLIREKTNVFHNVVQLITKCETMSYNFALGDTKNKKLYANEPNPLWICSTLFLLLFTNKEVNIASIFTSF